MGRQTITFGTRKARVPAAKGLSAPEWPCLGRAPGGAPSGRARNWPKITQKRAPVPPCGAPEGSVAQVDGQNQLGCCLSCLLAVFGPVWPRNGVRWAQNGCTWAPDAFCRLKPKNGRISGWTDRITNLWIMFPRANPQFRWLPAPRNGPNALLQAVFAHRVPL